jgi:hypothetical protein
VNSEGTHHLDSSLSLSDTVQGLSERPLCDQIHQKSTGPNSKSVRTEGDLIASNHIPCKATNAGQNCIESDSSLIRTTPSDGPVCILCDEPATVRLLPCGHEIICLICSKRAKKCLQCKVSKTRLSV